jgi:5,10-methylenetetrahydrofolate reductase
MSKIRFELNPPKTIQSRYFEEYQLRSSLAALVKRADELVGLVDGIHITDSVLGVPRISGISYAHFIRNAGNRLPISCSIRSRDRNYTSFMQFVGDAILLGLESILILKGDELGPDSSTSNLKPSEILKVLQSEEYDKYIRFSLAVPSKATNRVLIEKKILSKPYSLVTQSIESLTDLGELADMTKQHGVKTVACIMVPSVKNLRSAQMIGLDWSQYSKDPVGFVLEASKIADEVLLTSPNHFAAALEVLKVISNQT